MKKLISIFFATLLLLFSNTSVYAVNDPASSPNNKIGIHIFSEKDLDNSEKLVNSGGGDWGYITIVITEAERDHDRWQQVFDEMRRRHLIPIIRLATKANGAIWNKPQEAEINNWVAFLNSLNWVIQNRYVIIGNEPNHAAEWGGTLDPQGYGAYLKEFSQKLKEASTDFFVLPAALDASAVNQKDTMEESKYLKLMYQADPTVFDSIDGWNSHSYPNPDYAGAETDTGKGSIQTYNWELLYLFSLGVPKQFPVFITETGWSNLKFGEAEIARKYTFAFLHVWNDPKVIAVTPFILNYPQSPFDFLSWQKKDGSFYSYYGALQQITKTAGKPMQIESGTIVGAFAQPVIPLGSDYIGAILARNTGQSIWNSNINKIAGDNSSVAFNNYVFNDIEPTRLGLIVFKSASPEATGIYSQSLFLTGSKGQRITNSFPIEAYVTVIDWAKIQEFFGNIASKFHL